MKFVCAADLHIKRKSPKFRKDQDYLATALGKLQQIVDYTNQEGAILLLAGDIFDSSKAGYLVTNPIIEILKKLDNPCVACFGNHDTHFHSSDLTGTPFETLEKAGVLTNSTALFNNDHAVHILDWEGEPTPPILGKINILIGHVSVFEKTVPFWANDSEAYTPETLRKRFKGYEYYVTGDIHDPFVRNNVINPGSMLRGTVAQETYLPRVYLLDTDTGGITEKFLEIQKASEVFDFAALDMQEVKDNKALNMLISSLGNADDGEKPNFRNVLDSVIKEANPNKETISIISEILEGE